MILDNPFHVLGLLADCGARAKARREARAKAYLRVGQPLVFQDDIYFQGCRRNQATVERALSQLNDARDRIGYGLFWFTECGVLDSHALSKLRQGNLQGALAAWESVEARLPTRDYASCLNNLGTLCLLMALSGPASGERWQPASKERVVYLERGMRSKARLIGLLDEPELADFCRTFSDDLVVRDLQAIFTAFGQAFFEAIAEAEKYGIDVPVAAIVPILESGGPRTAELTEKLVLEGRDAVQRAINACAAAYDNDPSEAMGAGEQLMIATRDRLPEFAALVSKTDIRYTSIADQTAAAILDADVTYFNWRSETSEMSQDALKASLLLAEYAAEIACGAAIRQRARKNVETTRRFEQMEAMAGVNKEMGKWLEHAGEVKVEKSSPRRRIEFAELALERSAGEPVSALDLMDVMRLQGIKVFGPGFPRSKNMVDLGTQVCWILANFVVSAHNDSSRESEKIGATRILQILPTHFQAVSGPLNQVSGRSPRFFVSDECFRNLMSNVQRSRTDGIATFQSRPVKESGRKRVLYVLGGIVVLIFFAMASAAGC